jgi:hypothetical protein
LELRGRSRLFPQGCLDEVLALLCRVRDGPNGSFCRGAGSTLNGGAKLFDFFGQQIAVLAGMDIQRERAVAHALQLFHMVPGLLKHRANLAITAFDERDFVPGILRFVHQLNSRRRSPRVDALAVGQPDTGAELFNRRIAGLAADFYQISFWNMRGSLRQSVG